MRIALAIVTLLFSTMAFSAYEGGLRKVTGIRFHENFIKVRLSPPPAACQGNDDYRMHVKIDQNAANKNDLVAALLAAYAADMELSYIWFDDGGSCGPGSSLELFAFELRNK